MEYYFKDFEFFGFVSEYHMALTIVNEYNDSLKYSEDFRKKPFKELIEHWIDNNSKKYGVTDKKSEVSN